MEGSLRALVALYVVLPELGAGEKYTCIVSCALLYVGYVYVHIPVIFPYLPVYVAYNHNFADGMYQALILSRSTSVSITSQNHGSSE